MLLRYVRIILFLSRTIEVSVSLSPNFEWSTNNIGRYECSKERQSVVESYYKNGMQYLFFSQRVTWVEARILCHSYNARLAVLDTMKKALGVAESIAESNIVMEDTWLGGRRIDSIWYWIDRESNEKNEIPAELNVEGFPPWIRDSNRPTKECLAVDRRSHQNPNFVDLDCRLQRPFICEKNAEETITNPVPSKWVRINKNTFTLYHGRVTWQEAATFCRTQGARLAILKSSIIIHILANSMTKTRPDFETAWIGGHFSYGQWVWMATGSTLNPSTDENGFPPWRFGRPEKNDGCLLLDRHIENNSSFIELSCDRKRDFVCEEYSDDEEDDWMDEPVKFSYGNSTYILYTTHMTWMKSQTFCTERGSVLAYVEHMNVINWIIDAMGDHPREISHVWLGGQYDEKTGVWRWIGNGQIIPDQKDHLGFPPWAKVEGDTGNDSDKSHCLNLDRTDHVKAHFYGLDCHSKQSFVCKTTCDVPPSIKNGTWKCINEADGRQCMLHCDDSLILMGIKNVTCKFKSGWMSGQDLLEFPLCLSTQDYTSRLIRVLSHDIEKSAGYYIILDHSSLHMKSLSIKFAEQFLTGFPTSHDLKAGIAAYVTDPPIHLSLNQIDNCAVSTKLSSAGKNLVENTAAEVDINQIYNDISMYNGRKLSIIAVIDAIRGSRYAEALSMFKASGHHIIIIGSRQDWENLLPFATIGFDRRVNLFLFEKNEFEVIIEEFRQNHKRSKCLDGKNSTILDHMIYKESKPSTIEPNVVDHQDYGMYLFPISSTAIPSVSEYNSVDNSETKYFGQQPPEIPTFGANSAPEMVENEYREVTHPPKSFSEPLSNSSFADQFFRNEFKPATPTMSDE